MAVIVDKLSTNKSEESFTYNLGTTVPKYGWMCTKCNNSVHPDEKICPVCTTTYLPLPVPHYYDYFDYRHPHYNPFYTVVTC